MSPRDKKIDTLIIGQGLAGSMLAWQLMQSGQNILIACDESAPSASRVAAGLFNPVTGQRLVLQNRAETIIPTARQFYHQLEVALDDTFFHEKTMLRIIKHDKEKQAYSKRKTDPAYQEYLGEVIQHDQLHAPLGAFEQLKTGYLDTNRLLDKLKRYFVASDSYCATTFNHHDLTLTEKTVVWNSITADRIIFCEGFMGKDNPWFNWLPFQPAKGEILTLKTSAQLPDQIINGGKWLMPVSNDLYKTGATYDHNLSNLTPSESAKDGLIEAAQQLLSSPVSFQLTEQQVGVRPNTLDKQPFLGFHPRLKQIAIFNGFGSKGSMLIPHYAKAFASHIINGVDLPAEANINRINHD